MFITFFPSGPVDTNTYIVACPTTRLAAIIDPAKGSLEAIGSCLEQNGLRPDKILLTHSHWDHIADLAALKKCYPVPIFVHQEDVGNVREPGSDGLPLWFAIDGVEPDVLLQGGEKIPLGNLLWEVIHTPGHTPGGVCFYCKEEGILITGDTLFQGAIGNLSFSTARPKLMRASLNKLASLPKETKVYPGHGPSTTIGNEIGGVLRH